MKRILVAVLLLVSVYAAGRLYYRVTGGFTIGNISYDLPYDSRFVTDTPKGLEAVLEQPFHYLGKGCQSYVFVSADDQYVIKFFKYQRFRPQSWLKLFTFLPGVETYRQEKIEKKRRKLESVFTSWKIASDQLKPETGVIYVHLNKEEKEMPFIILDKMGIRHELNLAHFEFLIQKKAKLLCPTLEQMMAEGKDDEAKELLDRLVAMIVSEYQRGFADNDHALMQNTGVLEGRPVHIDVGQFVKNKTVLEPAVAHQELFNKTWKFRLWLKEKFPSLANHLEYKLKQVMGDEAFHQLKPRLTKGGVGALPHQD